MRLLVTVLGAGALVAAMTLAEPASPQDGSTDITAPTSPSRLHPPASSSDAGAPDTARTGSVHEPRLEQGANSFSETQARTRIESAGFRNVQNLHKDDRGIWRGSAERDGQAVSVGLDYKGNVARD